MNLRNAVVVGSLIAVVSGCAYLPEGYPARNNYESPGRLFVADADSDGIPVAAPKVVTAPEKPGLKIRKSKRGNMESYVVRGQRYFTMDSAEGYSARGVASWYGPNFHGRTASNGEVYDMYRLTAAHKTLPLPTYARVKHVENGRSVVVKINDRGPFSGDRIIDLSFAAALRLGMINDGTGEVEIQALTPEEMMVLSGPENKLDIDFYDSDEVEEVVAAVAPTVSAEQEELLSVAAVDVDQNPITPLPITEELNNTASIVQPVSSLPVNTGTDSVRTVTGGSVTVDDQLLPEVVVANAASVEAVLPGTGDLIPLDKLSDQAATDETKAESLDAELQSALMPVVADANVQGLTSVPAAVQTVPNLQDRTGYYIQAGVYADVTVAERLAVDVVLAAPAEEVHVKPLKDSHMYRITVGPIVSSEHASKVSGMLTEAGVENFTVRVK